MSCRLEVSRFGGGCLDSQVSKDVSLAKLESVQATTHALMQIGALFSTSITDWKVDLMDTDVMLLPEVDADPTIRLSCFID